MPKIAEIREIDGDVWVRVGKAGEFLSGLSIMSPQEIEAQSREYSKAYNHGRDDHSCAHSVPDVPGLHKAVNRAYEMLRIAGSHSHQYGSQDTSFYDGADCDGACIENDAHLAAAELIFQIEAFNQRIDSGNIA